MDKVIKNNKKVEMDLTTGKIFFKMPLFVFPLALTTIFQLLYTSVDLWTVSKFGGGSQSMAAVGSNSALINLLVTLLVSLGTGANVVMAQAKGALNKEKAEKALHTALIIGFIGGIIFSLIGFVLCGVLLKLMGTPESIINKSTDYLRIYFLGMPFFMVYNFGSQMLRALGDSRRPLYILIISGITNIVFDFIFVYFFNLDVKGVAYATVISGIVSAILVLLWYIKSKSVYVNFKFKNLKFDKTCFKEIINIGLPAGIQGLAFCIPNVMIQSSLYTIDNYYINNELMNVDEIVTGAAASAQIESYLFALTNAFSVGCVSFVGQNFGAKNKRFIDRSFWFGILWQFIVCVIFSILVLAIPYQLLNIFLTEGNDINITHAYWCGKERMYILIFTYFLDGIMDMSGSWLRGMNVSIPPAIITLIGCTGFRILFILTIFNIPMFHTIMWLYMAFPISWTIVDIVYLFVLPHYRKKKFIEI